MCERYLRLEQHCYRKILTAAAALRPIFFAPIFFVQELVCQTLIGIR